MYVYVRAEPGVFTVGHYAPSGEWHPDSDHSDRDEAARRVHYLNGGNPRDAWYNGPQLWKDNHSEDHD